MDLIGRRPPKPVRCFYAAPAPRPSFKASFTIGDCGRQFEESETEWPQSVQARYLADAYYATSGPKIRSPLALWERAKDCIYTPPHAGDNLPVLLFTTSHHTTSRGSPIVAMPVNSGRTPFVSVARY